MQISWRPFYSRRSQNKGHTAKWTTPKTTSKNAAMYKCLQVLVLHTAAVTKIFGESKAQIWGQLPLPQHKTAPADYNH